MHDLLTSSDEQQLNTHSLVKRCRDANPHAEMIVMSRHLRAWNIPECRQEGAVCPTRPDLVFSQATALWGSR
jgi:hypothetical protein